MIIAPSLLNSNIYDIQETVKIAKIAGDNYLHIDVMDGNFVPMQAFGGKIVTDLKKKTDLILDVHLMINNPELHIEEYKDADIITVHAESCKHLDRVIGQIHEKGLKAGVALNPATSLSVLDYVLDKVDMVLIMTVNPGFGGQKYIESCTNKISALRKIAVAKNLDLDIQVDGGINKDTLRTVLQAGANVIVAGSTVFNGDVTENAKELLAIMKEYEG